jgi:hypothetical protein
MQLTHWGAYMRRFKRMPSPATPGQHRTIPAPGIDAAAPPRDHSEGRPQTQNDRERRRPANIVRK